MNNEKTAAPLLLRICGISMAAILVVAGIVFIIPKMQEFRVPQALAQPVIVPQATLVEIRNFEGKVNILLKNNNWACEDGDNKNNTNHEKLYKWWWEYNPDAEAGENNGSILWSCISTDSSGLTQVDDSNEFRYDTIGPKYNKNEDGQWEINQ